MALFLTSRNPSCYPINTILIKPHLSVSQPQRTHTLENPAVLYGLPLLGFEWPLHYKKNSAMTLQRIRSTFRKYSYPLTYSKLFCVTAWIQNVLNVYILLPIYTQYPITTRWKNLFWSFCKCIENEIQKYLIYVVFTPLSLSGFICP
jgi:hypothetical protein